MFKSVIISLIILFAISTEMAEAQKLFYIPDSTPDYTKYKHPEECVASLATMEGKEYLKNVDLTFWADSARPGVGSAAPDNNPTSEAVLKRFNSCVSYLSFDKAETDSLIGRWIELFGAMGKPQDIDRLTEAWISSAPHDSIRKFREELALDYMVEAAESYRPLDVERLSNLYARKLEIVHDTSKLFERRKQLTLWIKLFAQTGLEDTLVFKLEESARILADASDDSIRWRRDVSGRALISWALDVRDENLVIDSLRHSTHSYLNVLKSHYKFVTGQDSIGPHDLPMRQGLEAPALVGNWFFHGKGDGTFREVDSPPALPSKGKVTLMLFASGYHTNLARTQQLPSGFARLSGNTSVNGFWLSYPILKRLQASYPDLDIVLVAHTIGYFINSDTLAPEVEASKVAQYWLGEYGLRASLVINNTNYFRLPMPDGRRVDRDDPNQKAYWYYSPITKSPTNMPAGGFVLIDRDGIVVHKQTALYRPVETRLTRMIDVLLRR